MSVEATALSRSRLEQKDRAELAAIVEAMGGKAGSRAKKADLVDQVLELAGAGTPAANTNGAPSMSSAPSASRAPSNTQIPPPPALDDEPPAEWESSVARDADTDTDSAPASDTTERAAAA